MYKRIKTTRLKELNELVSIIVQGNPYIYKATKGGVVIYGKSASRIAKLIGCKVYKIALIKKFPAVIDAKYGIFTVDKSTIFDEFHNL